jgi:hypothetical protein
MATKKHKGRKKKKDDSWPSRIGLGACVVPGQNKFADLELAGPEDLEGDYQGGEFAHGTAFFHRERPASNSGQKYVTS